MFFHFCYIMMRQRLKFLKFLYLAGQPRHRVYTHICPFPFLHWVYQWISWILQLLFDIFVSLLENIFCPSSPRIFPLSFHDIGHFIFCFIDHNLFIKFPKYLFGLSHLLLFFFVLLIIVAIFVPIIILFILFLFLFLFLFPIFLLLIFQLLCI